MLNLENSNECSIMIDIDNKKGVIRYVEKFIMHFKMISKSEFITKDLDY